MVPSLKLWPKRDNQIALLDLNKEAADTIAQEIVAEGGQAIGVKANVLEKESLDAAREAVNEAFGSCDILINGAGGNHPKGTTSTPFFDKESFLNKASESITFFDLDPNGVRFVFDLNFMGTLLPCQVFLQDMIDKPEASVLNISSMNAYTPLTKIPAYSGAKAAISNFTQWLAVHFAKTNIRVNAIAPGFFLTDQNRRLLTNEDGSPTDRGNTIIGQTPMGRYGTPEDLLGAVNWFVGDQAKFVTGIVVPIDGGFSAFSGV